MPLSEEAFLREFAVFKEKVRVASGEPFRSFVAGLPAIWEGYKPALRQRALTLMAPATWTPAHIGSGTILQAVVRAIEINESKSLRNNLVGWVNRFGHANRSHHALLDALEDTKAKQEIETLLFALYRDGENEGEIFEKLRRIAGDRYDLPAYLFFLRDGDRFMPIAPTTFDRAFEQLGVDLTTAHKCSWENYQAYNAALGEVRDALITVGGVPDARLIDAHSMCWMLIKLPDEALPSASEASQRAKTKKDPGKVFNALERSIWMMADSVDKTVKGALGPAVEKFPKAKELRMTRQQLVEYIGHLLDKQERRCALTGIPLSFSEEGVDPQLLASLDRIDSDGHYEAGNLQVVCRFINFWKGTSKDEEIRRLLALVRGVADE